MAVPLSDDERTDHESESDHEFESDHEGNFVAFTTTAIVGEIETLDENQSDGELFESAKLQEIYNKLCKIVAKDAMNVDLGLKKIESLEHEKKNLLVKLFDANELITAVKIENMSLIEKVKSLESELSITREQLGRISSSKLDNMLNVQKSSPDKIGLGFVDSDLSSVVSPTKFFPGESMPKLDVRVPKEGVLATRKIWVDLIETKPMKLTQSRSKKKHKTQQFCHFCGGARHTRPNCFKLQATKQATKQKVFVSKAQDPMTFIHELLTTFSLYAKTRVDQKSHMSRNFNSIFASKRVWMQKTRSQ